VFLSHKKNKSVFQAYHVNDYGFFLFIQIIDAFDFRHILYTYIEKIKRESN